MIQIKLNKSQFNHRVQWIRDLLSEQFRQGRGALKTKTEVDTGLDTQHTIIRHCCLGVLCERIAPNSRNLKIVRFNDEESQGFCPRNIARKVGFGDNSTEPGGDQDVAARWNDEDSLTFEQIANNVAYATEHRIRFRDMKRVPKGYAASWLAGLDNQEEAEL